MVHDMMPGTEEALNKQMSSGYIGFDPTADSLHVGNLVQIMILVHFQRAGHKPFALVGGATGMVGDPSGKSQERNLLDSETLQHNVACVREQLKKFLDFENGENAAEMVNNYDWFEKISFLDFIRDVGKHISVNYMMAKDSVKSRLESGMSFTEFSYQLVQGYDFYHLNKHHNCIVQMGGSDQWGNIVTGTELIRRKGGSQAFAVTTPLIKKADGSKFGKSESGNVWLGADKTSPYKFYQFWLNATDEDAKRYIKIFTLKTQAEIEALIAEHEESHDPRYLQKALAEDITIRVHSQEALDNAIETSNALFSKDIAPIRNLKVGDFLDVFDGIPQAVVSRQEIIDGLGVIDALSARTGFLGSNGEARRLLKSNAIAVNKEKVNDQFTITEDALLHDKYVIIGKGKKENFLIIVD